MSAVCAERWSVSYPKACAPALKELTFRCNAGERILLLGPSGSGKSTFVSSLIGLVPHSTYAKIDGELEVSGLAVIDEAPAKLASKVGVVFQDPDSQLTMLTVEDEMAFGLENLGVEPQLMGSQIDEALRAVGLYEHSKQRVDRLSGGMKQRLVIAAMLAMRPEILVLDEPTSQLDPVGVREITALIAQLCAKRPELTILLVEHRLDSVVPLVDRVLVLNTEGRLALDTSPEAAFGEHAAELWSLNVWLPSNAQARLAESCGSTEWCQPRLEPALAAASAALTALTEQATPAAPVVECRELWYRFRAETPVLQGVNLELYPGEVAALLGANGSGKSTLASLLVGLRRPDAGQVLLDGTPPAQLRGAELAQKLGYVFQNPEHQFVTDRVFDELCFHLPGDEAYTQERAREVMQALRLEGLEARNPFSLSHGQKRRLSTATMLMRPKRLLVLDEPTFGQDPAAQEELLRMLEALRAQQTSVLMITHNMDLVWRCADIVYAIDHGRLSSRTTPASFFADREALQALGLEPPQLRAYYICASEEIVQ